MILKNEGEKILTYYKANVMGLVISLPDSSLITEVMILWTVALMCLVLGTSRNIVPHIHIWKLTWKASCN